ncbi:DUF481 domain-containing protein [Seongchinamella sediminis]|uniref:DUF481 domain-containing protein n=1 Tax=Seongchinamella sediminis TaxID=2283635 RepID=A0A3L7E4I4_9GAMM|nr:DUF481 domain-containing protein [Seongchinamella sediminis]RLQ23421.1 DUF481 domain-containing protein [Seongchinamella sediminis]
MPMTVFVRTLALSFALVALLAPGARAEEAAATEPAASDEIRLKNGSRVIGKVTDIRDGVVTVETDFAGAIAVSLEQIVTMTTSDPATLLLADDTVIKEQGIEVRNSQLIVDDEPGVPEQSYALDQVLIANPEPWELGQGYNWTGLVSFAAVLERGNTDTDELDYKLESYWRSVRDRYTLKMDAEIDETNGERSAENWLMQGKYDYFLSETTYWGVNLSAEADEFRDLDLRYLIGPYIGRDFYTDPLFTLTTEVGASYVNEDFSTAEDQDYTAANWYLRMTSNYLGGDSLLYFDQRGIWNLDQTSDVVIDTAVGLSFPLLWGLEAAAEILWEYDSGAVEGVEEMDETYRLRIGYRW